MSELPQWISVAMAVRCSRMLEPYFNSLWPNAPDSIRQVWESAVNQSEAAATEGMATSSLTELADIITMRVGMIVLHRKGLYGDELLADMSSEERMEHQRLPDDDATAQRIQIVLDVAARAARAASATVADDSYDEARDAVSWTVEFFRDLEEEREQQIAAWSWQRLHELCEDKRLSPHATAQWAETDWLIKDRGKPWWKLWSSN